MLIICVIMFTNLKIFLQVELGYLETTFEFSSTMNEWINEQSGSVVGLCEWVNGGTEGPSKNKHALYVDNFVIISTYR